MNGIRVQPTRITPNTRSTSADPERTAATTRPGRQTDASAAAGRGDRQGVRGQPDPRKEERTRARRDQCWRMIYTRHLGMLLQIAGRLRWTMLNSLFGDSRRTFSRHRLPLDAQTESLVKAGIDERQYGMPCGITSTFSGATP